MADFGLQMMSWECGFLTVRKAIPFSEYFKKEFFVCAIFLFKLLILLLFFGTVEPLSFLLSGIIFCEGGLLSNHFSKNDESESNLSVNACFFY